MLPSAPVTRIMTDSAARRGVEQAGGEPEQSDHRGARNDYGVGQSDNMANPLASTGTVAPVSAM